MLNGDNLQILKSLEGERFDLAELDGPYMAGLEGWDILTEAEYIQHYAERLTALRPLLQPWGVVFVFGYPEGCAEIKSWANRENQFTCRRWISWYNNKAAHAGRRIQSILFFTPHSTSHLWAEFKDFLRERRTSMGITCKQGREMMGLKVFTVNGNAGWLWFESEASSIPSKDEYKKLKSIFDLPDRYDIVPELKSFEGLSNIDFMKVPPEKAEILNDDGLRSKPIKLYVDLFQPTMPPIEKRKALVLYGGSGNAAIAAEALGYEVTVIEQDPKRCKLIEKRSSRLVQTWREKLSQGNLWGFPTQHAPDAGDSAPLQGSFYTPAESKSQTLSTPTQRG
ncbi:MAG: site-specific DNA-methyltransferase [Chloroflexi bacterium]|nr:site-specific DNA-methyltransferase [Chloroflexota bacterium]